MDCSCQNSSPEEPLLKAHDVLESQGHVGSRMDHEKETKFSRFRPLCIMLGAFVGTLIQLLNIKALTSILACPDSPRSEIMARAATYLDAAQYACIWLIFCLTMTRFGFRVLQLICRCAVLNRRDVFLRGTNTLAGIVGGSFLAWLAVDLWLGLPVPVLPIVGTGIVDLILCIVMARLYEDNDSESLDDEDVVDNDSIRRGSTYRLQVV